MSYDNSTIAWSVKQISVMIKNGKFKFDNVIQRSYVWEKARKSLLIHSISISIPIPDIYAKRSDDGTGKKNNRMYDVLDGKQRLMTIHEFILGGLRLSKVPPTKFYNEFTDQIEIEDMSNKTFEELSEGLQEKIKNARITIVYFDNLTEEEERELFKRLNNGKPLSTKAKLVASAIDIDNLMNIGEHPLFEDMLTTEALANKAYVSIIMKVWAMINQSITEVSFESKHFKPLMESTEISEEEKLELVQVFNLIMNTHTVLVERKEKKVAKKMYTETHLISLVPFFKKAIDNGIEEELISDWITEFFKPIDGSTSVSENYNDCVKGGAAKNTNIQTRNKELGKSFAEFFKIDDSENENSGTIIPSEEDVIDNNVTETYDDEFSHETTCDDIEENGMTDSDETGEEIIQGNDTEDKEISGSDDSSENE